MLGWGRGLPLPSLLRSTKLPRRSQEQEAVSSSSYPSSALENQADLSIGSGYLTLEGSVPESPSGYVTFS